MRIAAGLNSDAAFVEEPKIDEPSLVAFLQKADRGVAAAAVGLAVGVGVTVVVKRNNQRATDRWQSASIARDALIEVSSSADTLFGTESAQLITKEVLSILDPSDHPASNEAHESVIGTGRS